MTEKVVIIGGGIVGASTGYLLAKKGIDTVIIDREDAGQATDAAAGIISPWLSQRRNKAWYQLAKGGARYYPEIIRELAEDGETDTGYERVGAIHLHTDEKKLEAMRDRAIKRREQAPEIGEVTILTQAETKSQFPLLSDAYASVHVSGAARVNGRKLKNALLRGAEKHGASFIRGSAQITAEGDQITGVSVHEQWIEAKTVVAAVGAWGKDLLQPLGVPFDIAPQRAQIMHVHMPGVNASSWPVVKPPMNQYMLPLDDGRIVIGATYEDVADFDFRVTAGGVHDILAKALHVAPELEKASILETRVGFRPVAPRFLPVIGSLPHFGQLLIANGLGATGLTMGPFIGSQLAKLVTGEKLDIDLNLYEVQKAIRE